MSHFTDVPDNDLPGIGDALVARVPELVVIPPRPLAEAALVTIPRIAEHAAKAIEAWEEAGGHAASTRSTRTEHVDLAVETEAVADRRASGMALILEGLIAFEIPGAQAVYDALYPSGVGALVRKAGRPQRGAYDAYAEVMVACLADRPELRPLLEPYAGRVLQSIAAFGRAMDDKEVRAFRAQRKASDARELVVECRSALDMLFDAVVFGYDRDSQAFTHWIEPLTNWRAAQNPSTPKAEEASTPAPSTATADATAEESTDATDAPVVAA